MNRLESVHKQIMIPIWCTLKMYIYCVLNAYGFMEEKACDDVLYVDEKEEVNIMESNQSASVYAIQRTAGFDTTEWPIKPDDADVSPIPIRGASAFLLFSRAENKILLVRRSIYCPEGVHKVSEVKLKPMTWSLNGNLTVVNWEHSLFNGILLMWQLCPTKQ